MKTAAESGPVKDSGAHAVAELVRGLHFEILPLDGTEQQVLTHLGRVVNPSVTASPSKGLDATVELSERLVRAGYGVVPHLSARLVRDRVHLDELLDRLLAAGIRELFVPAGDAAAPAGQFEGALALLEALGSRRSEFIEIDITGYPESHHLISDEETTIRAVFAKAPTTTHIIIRSASTPRPSWIGSPRSEPGARTRPTGSACRAAWTT